MIYHKPEKFGILREEHAFLSREKWKKLATKAKTQ